MKIRPVNKKDVPQIIKLIGDIWAEYDCVLDTDVDEKYLLAPDDYFRGRDGEFWIVEEDGKIIATVAVMMLDAKTAELKSLYVSSDFRKKGLGEKLTALAIDFARNGNRSEMILWSDTRFTKAHRLYERLGFERFGKRRLRDLNNSVEFGFRISICSFKSIG
ncbi:MAG: GNAT family N-acetyltransferase [Acidobacteriota bacterium]|nr:GNAT family N-acetyltransferase [Acidobacteriota bacterium]